MSSSNSNVYVHRKSKDGNHVLCFVDEVEKQHSEVEDDTEYCVEQDVVGRYAGNIEVRSESDRPDNNSG